MALHDLAKGLVLFPAPLTGPVVTASSLTLTVSHCSALAELLHPCETALDLTGGLCLANSTFPLLLHLLAWWHSQPGAPFSVAVLYSLLSLSVVLPCC